MTLTRHAIERYIERVKPMMGIGQARKDLERMMPLGRFVEQPAWIRGNTEVDRTDYRYFEISSGVVLTVSPADIVTTVLTCASLSPQARAIRNKANSTRRHAKRVRSRNTRDPRSYQ